MASLSLAAAGLSVQLDDVVGLLGGHQLRHALAVNRVHVTVGVQDQFAAIFMTLPLRYYFHVHASLNCSRDEHSSQAALSEGWKSQSLARIRQRLPRLVDWEQALSRSLALAQTFNQCAGLRKDRDVERRGGLEPINLDAFALKIDVLTFHSR